MRLAERLILIVCAAGALLQAQTEPGFSPEIRIYSEFERFDPFGKPVPADRDMSPREILSPAMPRNGHLTVHVVVTAPAGTNYFLYTSTNPPGILDMRLYREYFTRCGDGYCPDWLAEQRTPAFGAMPESAHNISDPAMDRQTTRCYLLDIYAPAATPPRFVRVEALLKVGTWLVAPMEVRIVAPVVPPQKPSLIREDIAPVDASSSATAQRQLTLYLNGSMPEWPVQTLRVRDFIQRNAAEDMLLGRALQRDSGRFFPELNLLSWWPLVYSGFGRPGLGETRLGAEWYLKVRDFLYRF